MTKDMKLVLDAAERHAEALRFSAKMLAEEGDLDAASKKRTEAGRLTAAIASVRDNNNKED